jgi:cytochrome c oxidase subunit 2
MPALLQAPEGIAAAEAADSTSTLSRLGEVGDALNQTLRRILFLPEQASTFAARVDQLHYFELGLMSGIAVVLGCAGIWFAFRYRRRAEGERTPRVVAPFWLEAGLVAGLLGLFLFWWSIGYRQYLHAKIAPAGATEVYVTGKQWMWEFAYARGRSSQGVLYVPAGRPVKLLATSRDVIHSFYVPAFRIKQDAVPGRYTTIWFQARSAGAYRIFCTELCGVGHSRMWGKVVALPPGDFDRWLAGWNPGAADLRRLGIALDGVLPGDVPGDEGEADLAREGQRVAAVRGCLRCHTVDGTRYTGPTWRGLYGKVETMTTGERVLVDEAYITESMMDPDARIVAGYPPDMPSYQGQISAPETAAVIEYIKTLRGAAPPDSVAPPPPGGVPR